MDTDNHAVRKIATSGVVSTLAGLAGTAGSADGVGTAAQFAFPTGIAVDAAGDAYVADTNNDTIRLCAYPSAPMITTQPQSQSVGVGTNVSFSVAATGMPPPAYQWYFNGAAIAGANGVNFTLSNAQIANAGSYTVTVTNLAGSATSSTATLAVAAPTTTVPPSGGSGGGGGGGAVEPWFLAVLAVLALLRRLVPLRKNPA